MKKKRYLLLFLAVPIVLLGFYLVSLYNQRISRSHINDFYTYINKERLDNEDINDGEFGWSNFTKAQEKVDEDVDKIVKDLIKNNYDENMNILYNNAIDIDNRNKVGIEPLKPYIDMIDKATNIEEFINGALVVENDLGIDIFTLATVGSDFNDTSKNIVYFYPITFDFGSSSDFYTNPDYSRYLALIKQYRIKLLKVYGYDSKKARLVSSQLNDFYMDIATNSKSSEVLSDVDSLYNIMTKDDLKKIYSNLDIDNYLQMMKIEDITSFSVVDSDNYKTINKYLTNDNLVMLKEYVKVKILENYGMYASVDYYDVISDFNKEMNGTGTEKIDDYGIMVVKKSFSPNIDEEYAKKYFSNEDKIYIEEMIKDIVDYYEKDINSLDWMSPSTKEKAILKLKKIKINVGYPDSYPTYSSNYDLKSFSDGSSLIENVMTINKTVSDYQLGLLKSNEKDYAISLTTVNAYYNPQDNSINFPAAIMSLYDKDSSYYEKLGSVGMVVAHEITHAFDNTGSKFDENGNRREWWSSEDYEKYEELQQKIINYYSNYEVVDGIYVDGKKTVGENIADLGAVNCIVEISKEHGASKEEFKTLFKAYASFWASEYIDTYQKLLVLMDNHSPDKIRVNAVLSSIDEFYEVYDIKENDAMFVEQDKRVNIW